MNDVAVELSLSNVLSWGFRADNGGREHDHHHAHGRVHAHKGVWPCGWLFLVFTVSPMLTLAVCPHRAGEIPGP